MNIEYDVIETFDQFEDINNIVCEGTMGIIGCCRQWLKYKVGDSNEYRIRCNWNIWSIWRY